MNKDNGGSCAGCFGIALLAAGAYILYQIAVFFKKPDAIVEIVNFIGAIGLCIGSIVALIIIVYLFDSLSSSIKKIFRRQSKVFLGQADVRLMLPFDNGPIPEDLPEAPNQANSFPFSVSLVMTNYGLWITANNPKKNEKGSHAPDEVNTPRNFLNEFNNSIIIPISNIDLYYLVCHRNGCLETEMGQSKSPGLKGRIPELPKGSSLKIVIVFNCILERDFLREAVRLEQPTKMKLTVQDQDGNDDLPAAFVLYELICDSKQEIEAQDDDSWMYHSRPMI
jgi:hypothetical protein